MKKYLHKWVCPHEKSFMLKAETILLATLIFLVFIASFIIFEQNWINTIISTILFFLVFLFVHQVSKKIYPIQETYYVTNSGISIHSKAGKKATKKNIKFSQITNFKLDKFFHGGRIETKKQRHPIYFNTKKEIIKLENILKKKLKS